MKNVVQRMGASVKRCYLNPWTVRQAKINVGLWTVGCLVAVVNLAIALFIGASLTAFLVGVSIGLLVFDFLMLKWSVTGLLWRKAQDQLEREESLITEAFYAMVIEEYKSR